MLKVVGARRLSEPGKDGKPNRNGIGSHLRVQYLHAASSMLSATTSLLPGSHVFCSCNIASLAWQWKPVSIRHTSRQLPLGLILLAYRLMRYRADGFCELDSRSTHQVLLARQRGNVSQLRLHEYSLWEWQPELSCRYGWVWERRDSLDLVRGKSGARRKNHYLPTQVSTSGQWRTLLSFLKTPRGRPARPGMPGPGGPGSRPSRSDQPKRFWI